MQPTPMLSGWLQLLAKVLRALWPQRHLRALLDSRMVSRSAQRTRLLLLLALGLRKLPRLPLHLAPSPPSLLTLRLQARR